jgi:hypothetical protein
LYKLSTIIIDFELDFDKNTLYFGFLLKLPVVF